MAKYNIDNHFNLSMSYTPAHYFHGMHAQWCYSLSGWMEWIWVDDFEEHFIKT